MATIQRSTTKVANKLLSYAEKRSELSEGVNIPEDYAKAQMKATRELWGKNDGIQAHHVIQSFHPDEDVSIQKANQVGKELAEKLAPGHEAVVYTHTDKAHTHNHIAINAVNFETGKKYHAHGKEELYNIREASDDLCKEHGFSIVQEKSAKTRHTLAEQSLLEKGKTSWKDEIRQAIDVSKNHVTNFDDFKKHLERDYGVETKLRGKTLSFKHPEQQRFVRANKLGNDYEMEGLQRGFERQVGRRSEHERDFTGDERPQSHDDELHSRSYERRERTRDDNREPTRTHSPEQRSDHPEHGIRLEQARNAYRKKQRHLSEGFDRWTQTTPEKQSRDDHETERTPESERQQTREHQRGHQPERETHGERTEKRREKSRERGPELGL